MKMPLKFCGTKREPRALCVPGKFCVTELSPSFLSFFIYLCVWVFWPAVLSVDHVCAVPIEAGRRCWILLDWSYRWL